MSVIMFNTAFTCTGSYAILILYGIKRTENRSAWPEPREGRAAISCSKSFCKEEYGQFIAWASVNLPPEDFEKLPAWREVKDWPGKVVGVCDYSARARGTRAARPESAPYQVAQRLAEDGSPHQADLFSDDEGDLCETWDEGYPYWWDLSNVVRLPDPIPCRGNVGMWSLSPSIAQSVLEQVHSLQTVKSVEANAAAVRIETPDDAYPLFRAAVPLAGAREGFFVLPIDAQRRPICKPVLVSLGHLPGTAECGCNHRRPQSSQRRSDAEQGGYATHFRPAIHRPPVGRQVPRPPRSRLTRLRRWAGICVGDGTRGMSPSKRENVRRMKNDKA